MTGRRLILRAGEIVFWGLKDPELRGTGVVSNGRWAEQGQINGRTGLVVVGGVTMEDSLRFIGLEAECTNDAVD